MIALDEKLLTANKETEILSAYIAGDALEASLAKNTGEIKKLAKIIVDYNPETILLTGSGASYCSTFTPYYFLKTSSRLPVVHRYGPVLELEEDLVLKEQLKNKKVFAIIASYSGKTADTVSVSKFLGSLGVPRIAVSKDAEGPLAKTCEYVLSYGDKCLYTSAMANMLMLFCEVLKLRGETQEAEKMEKALLKIPSQIKGIIQKSENAAMSALEQVKQDDFFYVLGDGALWAFTYQYGYTNLTEYSRVNAACVRSSEWRHGPLEILFRKPAMIHIIGTDALRPYELATRDYCVQHGAKVVTFDASEYFDTHPVLAPYALHAVTQFFFMYQSTDRGINMDDYLQMHVYPYKSGETYF
jgi:fructoselysine-6-P-deglycase FrlB-like protein